jgi:hypothetical protein
MNIPQAMRATADLIEKDPKRYAFYETGKPQSLDRQACVLGWIGYFMDLPADNTPYMQKVAKLIVGNIHQPDLEFYRQMDAFSTSPSMWDMDAATAAKTLRNYAFDLESKLFEVVS